MSYKWMKLAASMVLPAMMFGCNPSQLVSSEMVARVRMTEGGPQIFVNGKAVAPRMFEGRSGTRAYAAPKGSWAQHSLDFCSVRGTDRATVHMRFRAVDGGVVRLRNFSITEQGAQVVESLPRAFDSEKSFWKAWNIWDPKRVDHIRTVTNGVCELAFRVPDGKPKDYHFYLKYFTAKPGVAYRLSFEVQGDGGSDLVYPSIYSVNADGMHDSIADGVNGNTLHSTAAKAAAAGVDFVSYGIPADVWGEQADDFAAFDHITRGLIAANPNVRLIPRVSVNAPTWWLKKHPDHRMQFAPETAKDGSIKSERPDMAAISSRLYRKDAVAYISRFCRHMMTTYPKNFAGIHPTGQNTHEWFYYESWHHQNGYDPQTLAAFREFTGDPTAEVPTAEARLADSSNRHLLDPDTQKRVIEFNRFQQFEMTDFVAELAQACRRQTQGKKLVIFFYGYAYEFSSHRFGPANSGHYGMENLIRRADGAIDILCSPISYSDRSWIGATPNMSCGETVMRNGILWLNEDDSRTYLDYRTEESVSEGTRVNAEQSCQVMLRNTAYEAVHGFGSWWMDLPGWGWYDSEALWNVQRRFDPLDADVCERSLPFTPEVALVQDEESMIHVRPWASDINSTLVHGSRKAVNRSGVPHGQYLLFDVLNNPLAAKLQIFQSCWCLSDTDVEGLMRQKRENPAWRVWCWAAGAFDESGHARPARMNRLTGFKLEPHDLARDSRLMAKATPVGLAHGLKDNRWYGAKKGSSISFKVIDARPDEIWATYPNGDPAIVVRPNGKGGDIFLGVPEIAAEMVHAFAKLAGAHAYLDADAIGKVSLQVAPDAFGAANGGFGVLQAHEDVKFSLRLPSPSCLTDAITGETIGEGNAIPLELTRGSVLTFRLIP